MSSFCKNICRYHSDIFVHNNKKNRLGIEVYYCRACNIFIKIKEILNHLNIFKKFKKGFCDCCGHRLRMKARTKKQKNKLWRKFRGKTAPHYKPELHKRIKCKCGCGLELDLVNKWYDRCNYIKGHYAAMLRRKNLERSAGRRCLLCNTDKSKERVDRPGTYYWYKYLHGYLCMSCNYKLKRKERKKNNDGNLIPKNVSFEGETIVGMRLPEIT